MTRTKATHRGLCPVCNSKPALMSDGRIFRHFTGFPRGDDRIWPDGVCRGWGKEPLTKEEIEP